MTVQNKSNKGARSILNEAANTWNKIPMNIKESKTLIEFKKNYKKHILNDIVSEQCLRKKCLDHISDELPKQKLNKDPG